MDDQVLALARSQTAAAWFQAVFSVIAIVGSVAVAMLVHALEIRRAKRDVEGARRERRQALKQLLEAMQNTVVGKILELEQLKGTGADVSYLTALTKTTGAAIEPFRAFTREFNVTEIADADLWIAWAELRQVLELAAWFFETEEAELKKLPAGRAGTIGDDFDEALKYLHAIGERIDALLPLV